MFRNSAIVGLVMTFSVVNADVKLLSVKEYKKLQLQRLTSISNQSYTNEFYVEGYGRHGFECPPCPEGAQCGPCPPDYFIVSDSPEACKEQVKFINANSESCPDDLVVPYPLQRGTFSSKAWPALCAW